MADADLTWMSARDLARAIATRKVSSEEVVRNALARLGEVEPRLNAFVHRDDAGALSAARAADARVAAGGRLPPLLGVPVSVKDLIDVAGMPCSYGSRTMLDYRPTEDAPSVARLREAGAIILGKTATSEFGYRGYTESLVHGVTRNCWDTERTPGGSSGGAVTSVAAGVTPIALGTDGGGSIRAPCALTGLAGIKPQFGRVPIFPASATPTLAHVGPVARDVRDAALLLSVIAGPDLRDWTSLQPQLTPLAFPGPDALKNLRLAYGPTLGYARVEPAIAEAVAGAVKRLALAGAAIEEVLHVLDDPAEILAAEFIGGCDGRLGDAVERAPEKIDPPLLRAIHEMRQRGRQNYTDLLRRRVLVREHMRRFFERYDALLTPTVPAEAWPIGQGVPKGLEAATVWSFFTYPFNLTGQPAGSINCGFTASGLPIGLQIAVRPQREDMLVALMDAVETVLAVPMRRPPV